MTRPAPKPHLGAITNWGIVFLVPHGYTVVGDWPTASDNYTRTSPIKSLIAANPDPYNTLPGFIAFRVRTANSRYNLVGPPAHSFAQLRFQRRAPSQAGQMTEHDRDLFYGTRECDELGPDATLETAEPTRFIHHPGT